jgi:predicted nucleic acid-binding protein
MPAKAFFDTNVLVYSVSLNDPRAVRAETLLAAGGIVSVQVLNEFVSVARRKLGMTWREVAETLDAFRVLCPSPVAVTLATHESALEIAERYGCEIYDALIAAAALESDCKMLYSEDFQDRQVIEGTLTVRNPFK